MQPPDPEGPLAHLTRLDIREAEVEVEDGWLGENWKILGTDIFMEKDENGIRAGCDIRLDSGGKEGEIATQLDHAWNQKQMEIRTKFRDLDPGMFLPENPGSGNRHFPISGNIDLLLSPAAKEQRAEFDLTSPGGGLAGNLNWSPEEKTITGTINLDEIQPWKFSGLHPALEKLDTVRVPYRGEIRFDATTEGNLESVNFAIHGGEGSFYYPDLFANPNDQMESQFRGQLEKNLERIVVEEAAIDFQDLKLLANLVYEEVESGYRLKLNATVPELPLNSSENFWPSYYRDTEKKWVVRNVTEGRILDVKVRLEATFPENNMDAMQIDSVAGSFRFQNLTADYYPPIGTVPFFRESEE